LGSRFHQGQVSSPLLTVLAGLRPLLLPPHGVVAHPAGDVTSLRTQARILVLPTSTLQLKVALQVAGHEGRETGHATVKQPVVSWSWSLRLMDREIQPYKQTPTPEIHVFCRRNYKVYAQRSVEVKERQVKKAGTLLFELLLYRNSLGGSGKYEVITIPVIAIRKHATDHQHTVVRHRHVPRCVAYLTPTTLQA
jgi:hypothetical protein